MTNKYHRRRTWTQRLTSSPKATNQRAQLCAIIFALEQARTKAEQLRSRPEMDITIHTDSKYVYGCMTQWCFKWMSNEFKNRMGGEIANRDLIEKALLLEGKVLEFGTVDWDWVPRGRNRVANAVANGVVRRMEPGYVASGSDSPIRQAWEVEEEGW